MGDDDEGIPAAVIPSPDPESVLLDAELEKHFTDDPWTAVSLSALAFSLAHAGQGLAFLPLFPLALVLGLIAERTGSIVPCVFLHAMFNAVSVFLLLAQPSAPAVPGG
jgi:membrane protease YdiL (CAAX protease family)